MLHQGQSIPAAAIFNSAKARALTAGNSKKCQYNNTLYLPTMRDDFIPHLAFFMIFWYNYLHR
jgi:hypothetical protein